MKANKADIIAYRAWLASTARYQYLEDGSIKVYVMLQDWSAADLTATEAPLREFLYYDFNCLEDANAWLRADDIPW